MGGGDGPKAEDLDTKSSDLTASVVQAQSDGALFWKITEGRGDMPSARTDLTDEERWIVVHHLRSLVTKTTVRDMGIPAGARPQPASAPISVAPIVGGLTTLTPAIPADSASARKAARVELRRASEGGEDMLVATVTVGGRPAAGVTVAFFAHRHFGLLSLGEGETLDDGTAGVSFPRALPGNPRGDVRFRAAVPAPDALAGAEAEAVMSGGVPARQDISEYPRALWSTRTPIGLLVGITVLLLSVWSTYTFTIFQLLKLRGLAKEG